VKGTSSSLIDELSWRGLIQDSTDLAVLREHLDSGQRTFYLGCDPSASSLTIGNLVPMVFVMRAARAGLRPVVLLGGGTGLIGDPSGKSQERNLLAVEQARQNVARHQDLMKSIFERALAPDQMPKFVDNFDWLGSMNAIDFMRDVGKHFSVAEILRRDSVRRRMEDPDTGLTYTEFSYSLLQAYDFMKLCQDHDVTLQIGGSDQWGNIVAGIDYVWRTLRRTVYAITCPLLLRADGTKFGKTETGAIWISKDRTSPYEFYQFIMNLTDEESQKFALFFSLASREELEALFAKQKEAPETRPLQRHLANELTTLLHGAEAAEKSEHASQALFSGDVRSLDLETLNQVFANVPSTELEISRLNNGGLSIVDLLVGVELATSKRQAREFLGNNAVTVNGDVVGVDTCLTSQHLLHKSLMCLRRGKREWRVARFV
jgi:tyrosyl-tRNA synthetase